MNSWHAAPLRGLRIGLGALSGLILASHLTAEPKPMKILFDFAGNPPSSPWSSTNDGVMGGLSQGGAQITDDGMLFSGTLSLENNGGFSSVNARGSIDLSDYEGIRFSVLGDGRTYQLRLHSDAMFRSWGAVSFSREFATVEGEWIGVFVPFSELKQSWRGRELSGHTFNADKISRIGFMLADKQPGEFSLKVRWVAAANAP